MRMLLAALIITLSFTSSVNATPYVEVSIEGKGAEKMFHEMESGYGTLIYHSPRIVQYSYRNIICYKEIASQPAGVSLYTCIIQHGDI